MSIEPENPDSCLPDGTPRTIGFYSVIEIESIGFCGGYLVLNANGRPVEFHCTLPVLPERAQSILYGDSLVSYLHCEHIGPPLIAKARSTAPLVLVNQPESLGLARTIDRHVALIRSSDEHQVKWQAATATSAAGATEQVDRWLQNISLNLNEPFDRIMSAIDEAHAVTR